MSGETNFPVRKRRNFFTKFSEKSFVTFQFIIGLAFFSVSLQVLPITSYTM